MHEADCFFKQGRYEDALNCLAGVLEDDPDHLGALEILAQCQWKLRQFSQLSTTLAALIQIYPFEPGYHQLLAVAWMELGYPQKALISLQKCRSLGGSCELPSELEASLDLWKSTLVSKLLTDDPAFRVEYQLNPEGALKSLGIA